MSNKKLSMLFLMIFIVVSSTVYAATQTESFRDGDYRLKYSDDVSDRLVKFENGWFAFNDIIEFDTGTASGSQGECLPNVNKAGTYYYWDGNPDSVTVSDDGNFFRLTQKWTDGTIGNFTRTFFVSQENDMYILVQDMWEPEIGTYNEAILYGTCADIKNVEPTQVFDGVGVGVDGQYYTTDGIEPDDFTTYSSTSPYNIYGKIINNGTIQYVRDSTYTTTFTSFSQQQDGAFEFTRQGVLPTYDFFQNKMYLSSSSVGDDEVITQSFLLAVNSHDPALSPYFVDRQETRVPQDFMRYDGGKIGGYDAVAGYSYNLLSLATFGAKFAALYWNTPRQNEEFGYLIDRDLYRMSLSQLADKINNGEQLRTKYHYVPDRGGAPNQNGTPDNHYQLYDLSSVGLYNTVAQIAISKNFGSTSLNADPVTETTAQTTSEFVYELVFENQPNAWRDWNGYKWFMHSWQNLTDTRLYDGGDAITGVSGNVVNHTNATEHNTYGSTSLNVTYDASADTYGYWRKSFGAVDISDHDYLEFDIYIDNVDNLNSNDYDARFVMYDGSANTDTWYFRDDLQDGANHVHIQLNAPHVDGGLDLSDITEVRIILYDSNSGDFSVYFDNIIESPKYLQRSYVLNTHVEATLMLWKMYQYGYDIDTNLLYNMTNAVSHYLPSFETDPDETNGTAIFYDYRIWLDERPFNGTAAGDFEYFERYHYFSAFLLANLVDAIKVGEVIHDGTSTYDTSSIETSIEKACKWVTDYDDDTETSNAQVKWVCAFLNGDTDRALIQQYYDELVDNPSLTYGEDIALMRSSVDFQSAYIQLLAKVPAAPVIVAGQYASTTGEDALIVDTVALNPHVDYDSFVGLRGDDYRDLEIERHPTTGGLELYYKSDNPLPQTEFKWWEILTISGDSDVVISETEIPIEDIVEENGDIIINFTDDPCVNKKIYVDPFCDGGLQYDITPPRANEWFEFVHDGIVYNVYGVDEDGLCGFESVIIRTSTSGIKSCVSIEEDVNNPTGSGGESDGDGDNLQAPGLASTLDQAFAPFGASDPQSKGILGLVLTIAFMVFLSRVSNGNWVIPTVGGLFCFVVFMYMGWFPVWVLILTIVLTAIVVGGYLTSKVVTD